ncbi:MAG: hypothetical protein ABI411_06415 [Tahibacter sp.]
MLRAWPGVMVLGLLMVSAIAAQRYEHWSRGGDERGEDGSGVRAERPGAHETGEEREDGALQRAELFLARRAPPGETRLDPARWFAAEQHIRGMQRHIPPRASGRTFGAGQAVTDAAAQWEWLGPANASGRTRALVFHPQHPEILYAGGVSGGVWKSTDSGANWQPLSDDAVNLNIGVLTIDPEHPDVIYAGTGELYRNSGMPWSPMAGAGILKSTDGGLSWNALLVTQNDDFRYVSDLVLSPHDPRRLYAATNSGIWRSTDGGASFERLLRPVDENGGARYEGCNDLAIRSDSPGDWLLATCASRSVADRYWLPGTVTPTACVQPCPAAVFLNPDASTNTPWENVLSEAGQGRTQLDFHRANQNVVYAVAASIAPGFDRNGDGRGDYDNALHALFRSDDGGRSWQAQLRNSSPDLLSASLFQFHFTVRPSLCGDPSPADFYGAGWYNNAIAVDPINPDVVWVGGMTLFRSDDAGRHFGLASYYDRGDSTYVHPDVHLIRFDPAYDGVANQRLYATNDGGIAATDNARAPVSTGDAALCAPRNGALVSWRNRSNGLGTTQFYAGAASPDGRTYLGGAQDNGTWLGTDASGVGNWRHIFGGDGGVVAIDPDHPSTVFATAQYISLGRSDDNGLSFFDATSGLSDATLFIMPYLIDPNVSTRMFAGGLRLWRSDNGGFLWRQISSAMGGGAFANRISAIAVAPGNSNRMLVGNQVGIFRSDTALASTATTSWASVAPRTGWVSRLAFDPQDNNIAYATYSTFGGSHVWKSSNGGDAWTPLDGEGAGTLPDVPVHVIAIDPNNRQHLYIGTDLGLFASLDGGAHWAVENTGFANVITEDIAVNTPAGGSPQLFAFTYGRGIWRVNLSQLDGVPDYRIDERVAGMWWNAAQDGHGLIVEPIALDGTIHLLVSWFVYRDGAPTWIVGVGDVDGAHATVPMTINSGANFPPAFHSADVQHQSWGTLQFDFRTDTTATLHWNSLLPGFTSGEMELSQLVRASLPAQDPANAATRACHSGNWYAPEQDGHGYFLDVFEIAGQRLLLAAWYVFDHGEPFYLVGTGPIVGDHAIVQLARSRGPSFPPNYRVDQLVRDVWGTATFRFTDGNHARVDWAPIVSGYVAGGMDLTRLTTQVGRSCP